MKKKKTLGLALALLVFLAGGYYLRTRQPVSLPMVALPTATPFPPPDWKSYRHPTFGYSFFYPPDWKIREQGQINDRTLDVTSLVVAFQRQRVPVLQIDVSSLSYEEEIANRDIQSSGFGKGKVGEKITVGGREGVKVVSQVEGKEKMISFFVPGEDKTFIFLGTPEVIPTQDQTSLIDAVVSTFSFP